MYVILINPDNTLYGSVKQRVVQRSKLVDTLKFVVEPIYNGIDIDVNFSEVVINKEEEDLKDNNPIIRYLDNVNLKYWR